MTVGLAQLIEDAEAIRLHFAFQHAHDYMHGYTNSEDPADDEDVQRIDRILAYLRERYVPPSEPGSYKETRGIIEWKEGDEPAEDSIRRIRGG